MSSKGTWLRVIIKRRLHAVTRVLLRTNLLGRFKGCRQDKCFSNSAYLIGRALSVWDNNEKAVCKKVGRIWSSFWMSVLAEPSLKMNAVWVQGFLRPLSEQGGYIISMMSVLTEVNRVRNAVWVQSFMQPLSEQGGDISSSHLGLIGCRNCSLKDMSA